MQTHKWLLLLTYNCLALVKDSHIESILLLKKERKFFLHPLCF